MKFYRRWNISKSAILPPHSTKGYWETLWLSYLLCGIAAKFFLVKIHTGKSPLAINRVSLAINRAPLAINRAPLAINRVSLAINRAPLAINRAP